MTQIEQVFLLEDFVKYFSALKICHLASEHLDREAHVTDGEKKRDLSILEGAWVRGSTAGGCDKFQGRIILDSNNRASKR